jgi:predicted Zn-dependent protease
MRDFLWIYGYAEPARKPHEADVAVSQLAALPPYAPLSLASAAIGRTLFLAGRVDAAIDQLERATKNCFPLDHPIEQTQAHYFLGKARESKGDKAGACAAYAVVRDRWGSATSRSPTAQLALARRAVLRCTD